MTIQGRPLSGRPRGIPGAAAHATGRRASPPEAGIPKYLERGTTDAIRDESRSPRSQNVARQSLRGATRPLPHLESLQESFGDHDLSGIRAHLGASAQNGCAAINARAFAAGEDIAFAEVSPALRTCAHEVAHVIQRRAGLHPAGLMTRPDEPLERHAHAVAEAAAAGNAVEGLFPSASAAPAAGRSCHRGDAPLMRLEGVRPETPLKYVPFNRDGTWDAVTILDHLAQNESTPTPIPGNLPGAGSQSDMKRCGSNAALAAAIVAGPKAVSKLCVELYKRVTEAKAKAAKGDRSVPGESDCAEAQTRIFYATVALDFVRDGTGESRLSRLRFEDFDYLAHYIYLFTYNYADPAREMGRRGVGGFAAPATSSERDGRLWRSGDELADAAAIAGTGIGQDWNAVADRAALDAQLDALKPGESLLAVWGPHDHTFFCDQKTGWVFLYDPWQAGNVFKRGSAEFEKRVQEGFDSNKDSTDPDQLKGIRTLKGTRRLPTPASLFAPGGVELGVIDLTPDGRVIRRD